MLFNQYFLGSLIITTCVVFHIISLLALSKTLKLISSIFAQFESINKLIILTFSVLVVIAIHMIEIIFWALTYVQIGEFKTLSTAIYFSIVTSTTLGYGDIVLSERAQLLSGFEAVGGLILFGVSTAYFIKLIGIFFEPINTGNK